MLKKHNTRKKERRSSARVDARLSMRLKGERADGDLTQIVTESQNISASGVYCISPHYLAPLSKVNLAIVLPRLPGGRGTKDIISCEGIVVRCEAAPPRSEGQYQLACVFTDLDVRRRERIEQFVTWRNLQALRAATGSNGRTALRARVAATKATAPRTKRAAVAKRKPAASRRRETAR